MKNINLQDLSPKARFVYDFMNEFKATKLLLTRKNVEGNIFDNDIIDVIKDRIACFEELKTNGNIVNYTTTRVSNEVDNGIEIEIIC